MEELKNQIDLLKSKGFNFVSYRDLLYHKFYGRKNILITIDDGHRTVYDAYSNILSKYQIKPLLAIYPAVIGKTKYFLTWEQLNDLVQSGCEVASHGLYHKRINSKLYNRERTTFNNEIYLSKRILEKKLNRMITAFVYPYGVYSKEGVKGVMDAGYDVAFTVNQGALNQSFFYNRSFLLPRYCLDRSNWEKIFNNIIQENSESEELIVVKRKAQVENIEKKEPFIQKQKSHLFTSRKDNHKKSIILSPVKEKYSGDYKELLTKDYYGESNYYSQKQKKNSKREEIISYLKRYSENKKIVQSKKGIKKEKRISNFYFNYDLHDRINRIDQYKKGIANEILNPGHGISNKFSRDVPEKEEVKMTLGIISKNGIKITGQKRLKKIKNNFNKISNTGKVKKKYLKFIVRSHKNYNYIFSFFANKLRNAGKRITSVFGKGKKKFKKIDNPLKKKFWK